MENVSLYKYQQLLLDITQEGQIAKGTFELDRYTANVIGFEFVGNIEEKIYHRGRFKLVINGVEYLPEWFPSKKAMHNISVTADKRIFTFKQPVNIGNRIVELTYSDHPHVNIQFAPYQVEFILTSVLKES